MFQAILVAWSNINFLTHQLLPTMYSTPVSVNTFHNSTFARLCLANLSTGGSGACIEEYSLPYRNPTYRQLPDQCPFWTVERYMFWGCQPTYTL